MSVADLSATEVNSTADDTILQSTFLSSKTERLSIESLPKKQTETEKVLILYSSINGFPSFESTLSSNASDEKRLCK